MVHRARVAAFALGALSLTACTRSASFRGTATYVVTSPGAPAQVETLERSGFVCEPKINDIIVVLGPACVLHANATGAHYASVIPGQTCAIAFGATPSQTIRVKSGTVFAAAGQGVRVTFGGHLEGAPASHVAYDLTAPAPHLGADECDALPSGS